MMKQEKLIDKITLKNVILAEILALCVFYVEMHFCLEFINDKISVNKVLILHSIILIFLFIILLISYLLKTSVKLYAFILIETTVAGPLGAFISIISMLVYLFIIGQREFIQIKFKKLHPDRYLTISEKIFNRVMWDKPVEDIKTEPFEDILLYGIIKEKQNALIKIKKYFNPEFARFLLIAVNDKDNSIRVQAAAIIASIESDITSRIHELEEKINNGTTSKQSFLSFLKLYLDYAESGILDLDKKSKTLNLIIKRITKDIYNSSDEENSNNLNLLIYLAKINMLQGKMKEAYMLLKEKGLPTRNFHKAPNSIMIYLNTAFQLKKYNDVRKYLLLKKEFLLDLHKNNAEIMSILDVWGNE